MNASAVFAAVWIAWFVSWMAAALWRGRTVKQMPLREAWGYAIPIALGGILFLHRTARGFNAPMLWHVGRFGALALVGVCILGFAFAWWARVHMGKLWSGSVTLKENHRVIDTGPFALVRHPIYFGIIVALTATMLAKATIFAITGYALILLGIYAKARGEEKFLRRELGPAYDAYAARVPMLLPFGRSPP